MKHTVTLRNGDQVPALGLGTWYLGEDRRRRKQELESIKEGVHAGMTLIDTAEMYGSGKAELLVKEAMRDILRDMKREELYLVSKVLPNHAGKGKLETALDNTLMRMGVEQLDLYLYHWRGSYPLEETVAELERVKKQVRSENGASQTLILTIWKNFGRFRADRTAWSIRYYIIPAPEGLNIVCSRG